MKGIPEVIDLLNEVLTGELTAINQYFLHAKMCANWGYLKIAEKVEKESIDEMKHASELTDRILFLDGMPNLQKLGKLNVGETVKEQYLSDIKLEEQAISLLRPGIDLCYQKGDHTSRLLLEKILKEEEQHFDWLETQLAIIENVGLENYLSEQL